MTGLELAERYWHEVGEPAFAAQCPAVLQRAAVGLVGEGSECFGFDDAISRDHDWGPGFCVWLTEADLATFGAAARAAYASLPESYLGFRRQLVREETAGRVGVMGVGEFYRRYTGFDRRPKTVTEWRCTPDYGLAVATNGSVFQDPLGEFTALRTALLEYYPEELRRKKLACACALAAQAGQYNFSRCLRRGEPVAALTALGEFITNIQRAIFLLNRRYAPYYKWTHRALRELPLLGAEAGELLRALAEEPATRTENVERLSALVIGALRAEGLSDSRSDFLLHHAEVIQSRLTDPALRKMHLMEE